MAQQLSKGAQEDTKSRGALEDAMPACPSLILCVHVPGARGELLVSLESRSARACSRFFAGLSSVSTPLLN